MSSTPWSSRPQLTARVLLAVVAGYLLATQNLSFWHEVLATLPTARGWPEWRFIAAIGVVFYAALMICLALLTPGTLLKPMLILLLVIAAICSYFMDSYGVVIDDAVMLSVFQTDRRESGELLSARMAGHVLLQGVLPALVVAWVRVRRREVLRELLNQGALLLTAVAVLAAGIAVEYKDFALWARENRDVRLYLNPSYPIYSTFQVATSGILKSAPKQIRSIAADAHRSPAPSSDRPYLVVILVGETSRAANYQLDGYARATNPELSATDGLINYSQATSCGTSTAVSVPCMFSHFGRRGFSKEKAARSENLLDVIQRTGVDVQWLDNNPGCKGVCNRVRSEDRSHAASPLCKPEGCYDGILLDDLAARLPVAGQSRLLVLHLKGSHGPAYYRRYPDTFRRFVPDCTRDAVQTCSRDEIVNAYDNSILYTDHVIASLIAQLQQRDQDLDSVVLYLSDHGESLGEDGVYLHGLPYSLAPSGQTQIPMMAWFSPHAAVRDRIDTACARAHAGAPVSHDNLFDTVLGLFAVETRDYRPDDDILTSCRAP